MKKSYVSILMVILFSATLVSFSFGQSSCCNPGSSCCGSPNVSAGQQQVRTYSIGPSQTKVGTAKKPAPQMNPMPWSASVNQIGSLQRLLPASSTGLPGATCCLGTNTASGCCGSQLQATSSPLPGGSTMAEVLAFRPFLGTLW